MKSLSVTGMIVSMFILIQYGGGWGVYGPYGRPPSGAYRPPIPPPPPPRGPQMEPCIYRGDCRAHPPYPYPDYRRY